MPVRSGIVAMMSPAWDAEVSCTPMLNSSGKPAKLPTDEMSKSVQLSVSAGTGTRHSRRSGKANRPEPTIRRTPTVTPGICAPASRVVTGVSANSRMVSAAAARTDQAADADDPPPPALPAGSPAAAPVVVTDTTGTPEFCPARMRHSD